MMYIFGGENSQKHKQLTIKEMKMMKPKCKNETHEILTSTSFKLTRMIMKPENKKENKNLDS